MQLTKLEKAVALSIIFNAIDNKELIGHVSKEKISEVVEVFVELEETTPEKEKETHINVINKLIDCLLNDSDLYNVIGVNEAASILNVSPGHIKNLCAQGKIVAKKIGNTWVIDRSGLREVKGYVQFRCLSCGYTVQYTERQARTKDGLRCKHCKHGGVMINEGIQNQTTEA